MTNKVSTSRLVSGLLRKKRLMKRIREGKAKIIGKLEDQIKVLERRAHNLHEHRESHLGAYRNAGSIIADIDAQLVSMGVVP